MKILIIGSNGFIGSHLKLYLEERGHEVLTYAHNDWLKREFPAADIVVNCAGALKDKTLMYASNLSLVNQILEWGQFKKFIQLGSSSEYGIVNLVRNETDRCLPFDKYSATKIAATMLCLGAAKEQNRDICIVRPFTVYGPRMKTNLLPLLWQHALDQTEMKINWGARDWIYIDDFLRGLYQIINAPHFLTQGEIFNIGSGISLFNSDVVGKFKHILSEYNMKLKVQYLTTSTNIQDVDRWQAHIAKMEGYFGWKPRITLEQGLEKYIQYQINGQTNL